MVWGFNLKQFHTSLIKCVKILLPKDLPTNFIHTSILRCWIKYNVWIAHMLSMQVKEKAFYKSMHILPKK